MKSLTYRLQQLSIITSNETFPFSFFRLMSCAYRLLEGRVYAYIIGWKKCHVGHGFKIIGSKYISVGEGSSFGAGAWIDAVSKYMEYSYDPKIKIGKNFQASQKLHLSAIGHLEIGDDCLFGSSVYVSDHNHGSYRGDLQSQPQIPPVERGLFSAGSVKIGSNVWIGDNVVILGGVVIGNGAIVGANSVVTKNVPENTIVAGSPLRVIKRFNEGTKTWDLIA